MSRPLVSVIVPIYNKEKLLARCVDSIINQAYTDLEIILVDDGSTDGSLAICREYEAKDSRVNVVSKPNGGVSSALNTGLAFGHTGYGGGYIGFVDADDEMHPDMYRILVDLILKTDADIACCSHNICYEEGFLPPATHSGNTSVLTPEAFAAGWFFASGYPNATGYYWDKIYKDTLFETVKFDEESSLSQDVQLNVELLYHVNKIATIDKPLYNYWQYGTSLSHTNKVTPDIEEGLFKASLAMERYLYERLDGKEYRALRANRAAFGYMTSMARCYNFIDKASRGPLLKRHTDRLDAIYAKDRDNLSLKSRGFIVLASRLPWLCGVACRIIYKTHKRKERARIRRSLMPWPKAAG
jgi:glycosyltransferase involved in cell wall biosynthesis